MYFVDKLNRIYSKILMLRARSKNVDGNSKEKTVCYALIFGLLSSWGGWGL